MPLSHPEKQGNLQDEIQREAEHGESEYGGLVLSEESKIKKDEKEVIEHLIGDYPQNCTNENISLKKNDFNPSINRIYYSFSN